MNKNKLIIAVAIIFWLIKPLAAQPNINDSTEAYRYWAQRGIIEMVYAYMEDIENKPKKLTAGEKTGKTEFEKKFLGNSLSTLEFINQHFDSIPIFLKNNNWGNTNEMVFKPLSMKIGRASCRERV